MNETRNLIRYSMPAYVYGALLLLLMMLIDRGWLKETLLKGKEQGILGTAIGALFISGGLGAIFSSIHHFLQGLFPKYRINHIAAVDVVKDSKLSLGGGDRQACDDAWVILTSRWWTRRLGQGPIASSDEKVQRLLDQLHFLGSCIVANIAVGISLALLFYFTSFGKAFQSSGVVVAAFIFAATLIAFVCSYLRLLKNSERLIEFIFKLEHEFQAFKGPTDNAHPKCCIIL